MTDHEHKILEAGRLFGYIQGVKKYAVWKDGEQLVGVMRVKLDDAVMLERRRLEWLAHDLNLRPEDWRLANRGTV